MIPIFDNVSLVLCDKSVVKGGLDVNPPEYETTSVTTPRISESLECHQTDVYDENETVISISRTNPCTYIYAMLVTIQKNDTVFRLIQPQQSEKHKTIADILHNQARKTHRFSLYFHHKSQGNKDKKVIIASTLIRDNKKNTAININNNNTKAIMMGVAQMNDHHCLLESEFKFNPDERILSTSITTTGNLGTFQNGYNFFMGLSPSFAILPETDKIIGGKFHSLPLEDEEEDATSFLFENALAVLEQIGKQEVSSENKENQVSETIDTRAYTEDHCTMLADTHSDGGWKYVQDDTTSEGCDYSSIASSSSSACFETFDEVSVLTDEDFTADFQAFENLSNPKNGIPESEENGRRVSSSNVGWQGAEDDSLSSDEKNKGSAMMELFERMYDEQAFDTVYYINERMYVTNGQLYFVDEECPVADTDDESEDEEYDEDVDYEESEDVDYEEYDDDELEYDGFEYEESTEDHSEELHLNSLAEAREEDGFSASDVLRLA